MFSTPDTTLKRRTAISEMVQAGKDLPQIVDSLRAQGIVNPKTGKSYSRQTIRGDINTARTPIVAQPLGEMKYINGFKVFRRTEPISEVIGQWTYNKALWNSRILLNVDATWKDLVFWDALRRGEALGYQIGGLFCTPICQTVASHVIGSGITAQLMDSTVPQSQRVTPQVNLRISEGSAIAEANGKPTQNLKNAAKTAKRGGVQRPVEAPTIQRAPMQPRVSMNATAPDPSTVDNFDYTNAQLRLMMKRMQSFFTQILIDEYALGNQFVIINPDATFSVASPETVTVNYSAADYRRIERVIIRTKMEKATVEDVYTAEKRTITVHYYDKREDETREYENLIGRIPIVHFPCDRSANEIYGRPIYEAALPLMRRYDDLIDNLIGGVQLISNPIPVVEGLDNPKETLQNIATPVPYVDELGNTQTQYALRFDRSTALVLGKGGSAKFINPPVGFTKDSLDTLRQLFVLLLNHTRIPEFMWGGAISSSKASAETQLPPFIQYIKFRRLQAEGEGADPALGIVARGGLLELIDIWLRTYKLLNPAIVVGPVNIKWPSIDIQQDTLRFQYVTYFSGTGIISDEDALELSGLFEDPGAAVARAAGQDARPPNYDAFDRRLNKARLQAAQNGEVPPGADEQPWYSTDWLTPYEDYPNNGEDAAVDDFRIGGSLDWQGELTGGFG